MNDPIVIPCTLTVVPGGVNRQNKVTLSVSGETVLDNTYENDIDPAQLLLIKQIAKAHSRLLAKWSEG